MSKRAVVALSIVAALLFAYVALFERESVTSKELGERKGRVLPAFVRDKVERLEIERRGKRVVLERAPAKEGALRQFALVAPMQAPADQDMVDRVLGELEWLSARRTLEPLTPEDERRFGLHAPRYRVAFTIAGARHKLEIGGEDVHGDGVYARVDGESRAHVVPKSVLDVLAHEPGAFRDKQLLPDLTVAWVRKVTLERAGHRSELVKEGERWWLNADPRGYGDARRIEALLHALSELRAVRYVEPEQLARAEQALAAPALRIEASVVPDETREDKTPKLLGLAVGGACEGHPGERYARALPNGAPVCVREEDLKVFSAGPTELRDLRLMAADPSAVERFQLERAAARNALRRDGESWRADGGTASVDRDAVEAWLRDLALARAVRVLPERHFEQRGSLTLELAGGARERIEFGEPDAQGEIVVKRGDEPLLLAFPPSSYDLLTPAEERFASLEVWAAHQPSEVQRVTARDAGKLRTWGVEGGAWKPLSAASDAGVEGAERTRELVRALVDLRARAYVSPSPRAGHGLSASATDVELMLRNGKTLRLQLGAPTSAGAYARVNDRAVYEVEPDILGIIRELAGGARAPVEAPRSEAEQPDHGDEHDHDDGPEGGDHAH